MTREPAGPLRTTSLTWTPPVPLAFCRALVASALCLSAGFAIAGDASRPPPRPGASTSDAGPASWTSLSPAQRQALEPLAGLWPSLDANSRERWTAVATRFHALSPAEQKRVQERMTQWSKLPPEQRGEARFRFQQARQLAPAERQNKWAAYQALSEDERRSLAKQARRKQKPVMLADDVPGPREQGQQVAAKRRRDGSPVKSNVVPNPLHTTPAPTLVAPSVVRAGTGATTHLVSQQPSPPLHQQTGLPKIAATKGFVDPVTLLPRKGPQAAGMTSVPASTPRAR